MLPLVERGESFGRVLLFALVLAMAGLGVDRDRRCAQLVGVLAVRGRSSRRASTAAAQFVAGYQKAGMPAGRRQLAAERGWTSASYCLPAFLLIDVAIVFVLSLVMLGRLRAWREFARARRRGRWRAPYLFRNLSLPEWLLFAFVIGGLSPLATGMLQQVGANVLAVVAFLYLLQGLAIFRSLLVAARARDSSGRCSPGLLLGLLTLTGIAPLLLSIAGLFDSFFDFRHFKRKDHSDESHSD